MSNQVYANAFEKYAVATVTDQITFQTTFVNEAKAADVSAQYNIVFRRYGAVVYVEIPTIKFEFTVIGDAIVSTFLVPAGFRAKNSSAQYINALDNNVSVPGVFTVDAATGLIIIGRSPNFTVSTNNGMSATVVSYISEQAA